MIENNFHTFTSYIKDLELTPNEEDYVEMIYRVSLTSTEKIRVSKLAELLNITPPSVSKMIKKLAKKDILFYEKYGDIKLTLLGQKVGERLMLRHETIKNFLYLIGDTDNTLEKTEKIEHVIDEDTLLHIMNLVVFLENSNYKK